MTKTFPWDQFDTVAFERGVCIRRHASGEWVYLNSENAMSVSDPDRVLTALGVRPVLAEGSHENARVSFLLPAIKGRLLDIYRSELELAKSLTFVMGAMLHHCSALAGAYAEACGAFAEQEAEKAAAAGNSLIKKEKSVTARMEKPFYLFETIMTLLIIGCDYLRHPVWRKYASGAKMPRSFADTIAMAEFPPVIAERIQLSQETSWTLSAKQYRRCVQHHLDAASSSWCRFEQRWPSFWVLTVGLPDNPGEKSAGAFSFDQGVDALTLAWECVSEFFALTDILLGKGDLSSS